MRICFLLCIVLLPLPALAQLDVTGIKHDSAKPIDITADRLTVRYKDNAAVFKGTVNAVQGELRITADRMEVFYQGGGAQKKDQKPKQDGGIRKVVAEGSVRLTVPEKSASGDNGVYDVEKGEVVLTGHVLLTQGPNRLNGERFVYDVNKRESNLYSNAGATAPRVTQDGSESVPAGTPTGTGRVRGYFIPKQ